MKPAHIKAKVSHNGMHETLQFVVNSEHAYTVLPKSIWRKLKLSPSREQRFTAANSAVKTVKIAECLIELEKKIYSTLVILGEKEDVPRLGALDRLAA
jgi:predicted aspartyl protease